MRTWGRFGRAYHPRLKWCSWGQLVHGLLKASLAIAANRDDLASICAKRSCGGAQLLAAVAVATEALSITWHCMLRGVTVVGQDFLPHARLQVFGWAAGQ